MFALRQTVFFCLFLLVLTHLSDGLTCYSCLGCNDPFNSNDAQTVNVSDNQEYSCRKISAASIVNRDASQSCSTVHILGNGQWCCQTNLCNNAKKSVLTNFLLFAKVEEESTATRRSLDELPGEFALTSLNLVL